jgi:hypothetical protein
MCFHTHTKHQEVKIATEDIECYKILTTNKYYVDLIISPFYYEIYFKNADTHPVIKRVKEFGFNWSHTDDIEEGLHSYSTYNKAKLKSIADNIITIHKAIIPKGTEYYYNSIEKEYVSLKLKVWKKNLKLTY